MVDASEGHPPVEGMELFRLMANCLTDYAVFVMDGDRRVQVWLPGAQRLLGYTSDEMVSQSADRIFSPDDIATGAPEREAELAKKAGWAVDDRWHVCRDGSRFWASGMLYPMRDAHGAFRGFVKVLRNLTGKKRAEDALRDERDFASALVNGLPGMFYLIDAEGRFVRWNKNLEQVTGYSSVDIGNMKPADFFAPADQPLIAERVAAVFAEGRASVEVPILTKDGQRIPYFFTGTRVLLGGQPYLTGLGVDIADRVRAEAALREADRQKDVFLATLAHELRNPLASIRSGLEVIRLADSRSAREQTRAMLERQVARLARLVDDLMDVARISRGKITLRRTAVDLGRVAAEAAEEARPMLDVRRHRFEFNRSTEAIPVDADPIRLAQVVMNLLTNATKYTPNGGMVTLSVGREGEEAVLRVSDTGVGIAPDVLPRVFDPFAQADLTRERSEGGLGIGLALVKELVGLHGGTASAESEGIGRGCVFTIRLPIMEAAAATPPALEVESAGGSMTCRVLVVDDNTDAADTLGMLLEMQGHEVRVAHDGPSALALAPEWQPDIVLLDLGMPGMSGYEVASRFRASPEFSGVRLVALTGWGTDEDRRKSRESGFDHHLTKPVDPGDLTRYLAARRDEG